jgi:hypothetical protein
MAGGLNFITFNPATLQMRENDQQSERARAADLSARRGEFELGEAQRSAAQERVIDQTIRDGLKPAPGPAPVVRGEGGNRVEERPLAPPPGSRASAPGTPIGQAPTEGPAPVQPRTSVNSQVADRLAATPGGGRMALQMRQNAERERDANETRVFQYLSNPATAHVGLGLAQQLGMQIPEQLANNTSFWQGTSIAKQLYPDDPGAAQRFVQGFVNGGGGTNIQAATQAGVQAAGAPVKKRQYSVVQGDDGPVFYDVQDPSHQINGPANTRGQFMTDKDGNTVFLRQGRTQAEPVTDPSGNALSAQRFGATARVPSVYDQKFNAYLSVYPNDRAGALAYAQGTKQIDPANEQRIATEIAKKEMGNPPDPVLATPDQQRAYQERLSGRVTEIVRGWHSASSVRPGGGGMPPQGGAPATPQPQAPAPAAQPEASQSPYAEFPEARQAPDGRWYVQQGGQWFEITTEGQ